MRGCAARTAVAPRGHLLPARALYTATLLRKALLSRAAACYHLEFVIEQDDAPRFEAGQFLSLLADDAAGKTYTRAYSLASAPQAGPPGRTHFDLCVNRVEHGFFSNRLCDLQAGATILCHGPHGLFTLQQPPSSGLMVAAGTGIAPMRGFIQSLFAEATASHGPGLDYWLIYEAPEPEQFFYNSYFERVASAHANFHYLPVHGGEGAHEALARAIRRVPSGSGRNALAPELASRPAEQFDRYAYVCGLSDLVKTARQLLLEAGWQKRQILFERYD